MKNEYFKELKDYDFKLYLEDINIKIEVEQDLNYTYKINFKNTDDETVKSFTTQPLINKYKSTFSRGIKKNELEKMIEDNSKYMSKDLRSSLYIAWYDLAINEKNKPAHTNILLSKETRRIETYKEIEKSINEEITLNKELKENGKLINLINNAEITGSVVEGSILNDYYDTDRFNNEEYYFEIPLSKTENKTLFIMQDYESSTEYRCFIGRQLNGIFSMREDISFSKEDEHLNSYSIGTAINNNQSLEEVEPEVKNKVKLKM